MGDDRVFEVDKEDAYAQADEEQIHGVGDKHHRQVHAQPDLRV